MPNIYWLWNIIFRFINARRRILQPMLDASNPEPTKKAKSKPQNRPLQRFWPESIANIQPQLPSGLQTGIKSETSTSVTDTVQTQPIVIPIVSSEFVALVLLCHKSWSLIQQSKQLTSSVFFIPQNTTVWCWSAERTSTFKYFYKKNSS